MARSPQADSMADHRVSVAIKRRAYKRGVVVCDAAVLGVFEHQSVLSGIT